MAESQLRTPPVEGSAQDSAEGTTSQAQDKAKEVAGQAQEKAQEAGQQARDKVRQQVDERSTQAGEQVKSAAGDARSVAEELRKQGKDTPAKYADQAAERVEKVGSWLAESNGDKILRDVERFGRSNPWAVVAGGIVLGAAASRLLKASSSKRYQSSLSEQGTGQTPGQSLGNGSGTGYGAGSAGQLPGSGRVEVAPRLTGPPADGTPVPPAAGGSEV